MTKKKKLPVVETTKYLKEFDSGFHIEYVVEGSGQYDKNGTINLKVKMSHLDVEVPFCATPDDFYEHGRWLYEEAKLGTFGVIAEYERPLPTAYDLQVELDKLMVDVTLGLATDEEVSLARTLRKQIKVMEG